MKGIHTLTNSIRTRVPLGALLCTLAVALTACAPTASGSPGASADAAESVTVSDAWVKAADSGMSAAFGELKNSADAEVTIVSATSKASSMLELHETVENGTGQMVMRERAGGFSIPANGSLELAPGGNHIMLMNLTAPLKAGEEVTFTLTFSDGSTSEFSAPVKDYAGANEQYADGSSSHMGSH